MDKAKSISLEYINILQDRLQIYYDGIEPVFVPDNVNNFTLHRIKNDITDLFEPSINDILHSTYENGSKIIQGVGFGLIDDFEKFIKIGLLYSNRLILWDFIWGRMLADIDNDPPKLEDLGVIANNLVKIKQIVQNDGAILLPHPTSWDEFTLNNLKELESKGELFTAGNYGLVSALSVSEELNLHPYTLFEPRNQIGGNPVFNKLFNEDKMDYLLNLTELLNEKPFLIIDKISAVDFHTFLKENPKFFQEFRDTFLINSFNLSEVEKNQKYQNAKDSVIEALEERERKTKLNFGANIAQRIIHLAALANILYGSPSGPNQNTLLISAIASLSASLGKYLFEQIKQKETNTLIIGFEKLNKVHEQY